MLKLSKKDIRGVVSYAPTPGTADCDRWDKLNSVDLDKVVILENKLIASGVGVVGLCGTTGENAALLWDEKREFIATAVKAVNKRVPVFAGCTALGTKEVIRQMREMQKLGADGAFVGLPLWQTPTIENSVQWYADLAEALPDFPIMVYGNAMFFKSTFPVAFWEGINKKGATVITCKTGAGPDYADKVKAAGDRVFLLPAMMSALNGRKVLKEHGMDPSYVTGLWTTSMWPEPWVALANAMNANDADKVELIKHDIESVPGHSTEEIRKKYDFASYNAQVEHHASNSSGYLPGGFGPNRPPYRDLPEEWRAHIWNPERIKAWHAMVSKYTKTPVK